ncbi:MAG TPA: FtsX-like permease family protein [Gemmatimonadaceae bacterium]|nr:FtsX-like permease family protein [Gemmatimonadaceae bacterium]
MTRGGTTATRWRSLARLAWRESRTARRRLLLYMSSIALGVAALVAIDSFASNVTRSIRSQSRALLGGDLAFASRAGFPPAADSLLDSLARGGTPIARVTTFASMATSASSGRTRLAQVRAVTDGYPFYGDIVTSPAGQWARLHEGRHALVDPSLLIALDARVGDTLALGYGRFVILGALESVPGDPGIAAAIGPRVFIAARWVPETQLLGFGSRAEYDAVAKLPEGASAEEFIEPFRPRFEKARVRVRTVAENELNLTDAIAELGDFLGIVGLVALLLGGIGVASGVSAFVARKIDTVAVLRCLGATSRQVLVIYSAQAALMGLVGAAAGAALGVAIQFTLPIAVSDFLPVDVRPQVEPLAILLGLGVGLWVALVFALRPLLSLRRVSPLQALRRDTDDGALRGARRLDPARLLVDAALALTVFALAVSRSESLRDAAGVSAGIAGVLLLLWLAAGLLSRLARRFVRAGWPYIVRQGVANLWRPANQTRAVILSLGFGAFLVSTLYLVQSNLLRRFEVTAESARANLVFFDVQEDQVAGVDSLVRAAGETVVQQVPIVTMRIAEVNGRPTSALLGDTLRPDSTRRAGWALRREYRSTYRTELVPTEKLVAGTWFPAEPRGMPEVSFEQDVAQDLKIQLGDTVTWDVQGVRVPTRVTSLREVNWARFEPNFFAVFQPAAIERAPKQVVVLARTRTDSALGSLQRQAVDRWPNVSSIDLSLVQRTIGDIQRRVSVAVRFLAIFSLAMGIPVLFSAVAATRRARLREGVLLKTLGATRRQVRDILLAEYVALGVLGALSGMVLSFGGAWALMRWVFKSEFAPATGPALVIALLMVALTVVIGLLSGREVFRETPMAALRES